MAESKQIQYLNKDFDGFKQKLLEFAQVYYPDTYNDFSETSTGTIRFRVISARSLESKTSFDIYSSYVIQQKSD